jgi:antitoxin component YwqK of YwqJK toxin-antitoxin module
MRGGILDGTTVFFAPDGREKGRAEFKRGVLDGAMTLRDEQGRVSWSAGYRAGVPHGDMSTWTDGVLAETVPYVEGRRQGTALAWRPEGTTASSLPYVADRLEGTALWFSAAGRKTRSAAYLAGALDGESLDFYPATPAEAVRTRSVYSQGKLNGPVTQYDTDGRALMRAWFTQGDAGWSITCLWGTLSPSAAPDGSPPPPVRAPNPVPVPAPAPAPAPASVDEPGSSAPAARAPAGEPIPPAEPAPAAEPIPPIEPILNAAPTAAVDPIPSAEPGPAIEVPAADPAVHDEPARESVALAAEPTHRGIWFVPAFFEDPATREPEAAPPESSEDGERASPEPSSCAADALEKQVERSLMNRMFAWMRNLNPLGRK